MTRIWYCAACGYEVTSRGRCHACRAKLTPSAMPELHSGPDDEEVGYRIEGWPDRDRGLLIVQLNDLGIEHRFEDEELIVDASDEDRVDDLIAVLADGIEPVDTGGEDGWEAGVADELELDDLDGSGADPAMEDLDADGRATGGTAQAGWEVDPAVASAVGLLADAASRLRRDPTDMQADGDVAEASASVFLTDRFGTLGTEEWSAVGRVTRRLLSLLGADEALEDSIHTEAGVLEKLLAPVAGVAGRGDPTSPGGEQTVYELPEWLPEQRAHLGVLLDDAGIPFEWDGEDLVVPESKEDDVEALFEKVEGTGGPDDDDADENRYQAVAELFAACGRLAADPYDEERIGAVLEWVAEVEGPALLGMDEVDWLRIMKRAHSLVGAIEADDDTERVGEEASALHDLLRAVV